MVEIALAMVVIALGISGILGLFTVGVNSKKAAIRENNVADAAEYVLGIYKAFVATKYETWDGKTKITVENLPSILGLAGAVSDKSALNIADWDVNGTGTKYFRLDGNTASGKETGIYYTSSSTAIPQIFCYMTVREGDTESDGKKTYIADSQLQGYIWATKVPATFTDASGVSSGTGGSGTKTIDLDYEYGVRIYLELSQPVEKPYDEREKQVFVLDVMNPNLKLKAPETQNGTGAA